MGDHIQVDPEKAKALRLQKGISLLKAAKELKAENMVEIVTKATAVASLKPVLLELIEHYRGPTRG